jgi:hypothetical protein
MSGARRYPKPEPRIAITVRVPVAIEEQRRRLEVLLDVPTPVLFARALNALEAQTAFEIAKATAA